MNLKVVGASMISFAILAIALSLMTSYGMEKVDNRLIEQQKKAGKDDEVFKASIEQDLTEIGASGEAIRDAATEPPSDLEGDFGVVKSRHLRPSGKWMGVRKEKKNNLAFLKFDDDQYWLKSKDDRGNDIREHGRYEYHITDLFFYPDGGNSYSLQYSMVSNDCIELSGNDDYFRFQRSDDFDLDF